MIRRKTASAVLRGLFLIISVLLTACRRETTALLPTQREAIQARVSAHFYRTVLFQPRDAGSNGAVALRLAPLIVQEVTDTNAAGLWQDKFAMGDVGPLVVSESNTTVANGRSHEQVSYFWSYPPNDSAGSSVKAQGIRITLNAAGEPVIWEVLADSTGADILYVAQSLELAARAEFGAPLPGRKFSIERSVAEAPDVVIANVIDDGPTPMGPVVYLRKGSRDVSALICRCMPSQGGTLLGQTNYELRLTWLQTNQQSAFPPALLEQRLRLPRSF